MPPLPAAALDQLFVHARTHHAFFPEPIPEATLRHLYDLMKWGADFDELPAGTAAFCHHPGGQGKTRAGAVCGQPGKDPGRPRRP
jgi:3-hydroxypropanoate dehydrogenase